MEGISWAGREVVVRRKEKLAELQRDVEEVALDPRGPVVWLAGDGSPDITAESIPEWGVVILNDRRADSMSRDASALRLLDTIPHDVLVAVCVHEYVHHRLGGHLRCELDGLHPDVGVLFRERIVPDWQAGTIEIAEFRDYISNKGWRELYIAWEGPEAIDLPDAKIAINAFFNILKRGRMRPMDRTIMHPGRRKSLNIDAMLGPEFDGALDRLYDSRPGETASLVMTGLELAKQLSYWLDNRDGRDLLLLLEEGFATYVASSRTGVSIDDIDRYARQDARKVDMARRIESAKPTAEMIEAVRSTEDLFAFGRECGVVERADECA